MADRAVLELHLSVDAEGVVDAVDYLRRELREEHWRVLAQLAMEVVSRWESAAAGQRMVVIPAREEQAEVLRSSLRLQPAGLREP